MKRFISIIALTGLVVSCGSKQVQEEKPREFVKDYNVVDASETITPSWILAPETGDKSSSAADNKFFVNESENINKRLCLRSAEARATSYIASEIAQFIKNSYAEATQGGESEVVSEYMQEQLASETQSFIVGSSVHKTYWEKRSYKKDLGAVENKVLYNCFALVKISKKNLEKAIENSKAKLLNSIKDPEVKSKTDSILEDVATKFNEV